MLKNEFFFLALGFTVGTMANAGEVTAVKCYRDAGAGPALSILLQKSETGDLFEAHWKVKGVQHVARELRCEFISKNVPYLFKCSGPSWDGDIAYNTEISLRERICSENGGETIRENEIQAWRMANGKGNPGFTGVMDLWTYFTSTQATCTPGIGSGFKGYCEAEFSNGYEEN